MAFVPIVGPLTLLVFLLLASEPYPNEYGPSPKALPAEEALAVYPLLH